MNYRKNDVSLILGYQYTYDANGNISATYPSLAAGGISSTAEHAYTYDSLNQLTRVVDHSDSSVTRTYQYTYDTAGNILTMTGGADGDKELSYTDTVWKDRLTKVQVGSNWENITYETAANGYISGNPVSYFNGRHYDFTWQKGRQLATATVGGVTSSYAYDMAGVRSSKTVGTTEYKFDTLSGLVMRQSWDGKSLYFLYDDSSQPYGFAYQSSETATPEFYFYVLNLQGDVAALIDSSADTVAKYRYDPWGAVTVLNPNGTPNTTGTFIGNINPLRYRGYYYDSETGLYYLQSRYYDPAIGRFINADIFITTDAGRFLSYNMFAYCENDPVNKSDATGNNWEDTFKFGLFIIAAGVLTLAIISSGGGALLFAGVAAKSLAVTATNYVIASGTTVALGSLFYAAIHNIGSRTSASGMQKQVEKGQAPKEVDRVDPADPRIPGNKDHVHFRDGTAINYDGTASHEGRGIPKITNKIANWMIKNGWKVPLSR